MLKHCLLLLLVALTIPAWARNWNASTDWRATGNGKTDDSPAIQRGVAAMWSGDTEVFPAPGTYFVASTVSFKAPGIRVKCEPGAALLGPNRGTDIFANLQSDTAIGGSVTTGCIFRGGGVQVHGRGGDTGQILDQTIFNLTFTYNTFENMTYGPNNFRSHGANYDVNAGGQYPEANTFGLSAPFARAKQPGSSVYTSIPMGGVIWYNNLVKGDSITTNTSGSASKWAPAI